MCMQTITEALSLFKRIPMPSVKSGARLDLHDVAPTVGRQLRPWAPAALEGFVNHLHQNKQLKHEVQNLPRKTRRPT